MRGVRAAVDVEQAERLFASGLWRRLVGTGRPPSGELELVRLPYHLVPCRLRRGSWEREALILVDGIGGGAARLAAGVELRQTDPPLVGPRRSTGSAAEEARAFALRSLLLRPWRTPHDVELSIGPVEPIAYPFWCWIYERRAGRLDVRVRDGVSGRPAGVAVRRSLISALLLLGGGP